MKCLFMFTKKMSLDNSKLTIKRARNTMQSRDYTSSRISRTINSRISLARLFLLRWQELRIQLCKFNNNYFASRWVKLCCNYLPAYTAWSPVWQTAKLTEKTSSVDGTQHLLNAKVANLQSFQQK